MNWIFDLLTLLVLLANLAITAQIYLHSRRHAEEDAADEAVEEAQRTERIERDLIGEGLDNIMLYSVNGKTGFEPENWQEG